MQPDMGSPSGDPAEAPWHKMRRNYAHRAEGPGWSSCLAVSPGLAPGSTSVCSNCSETADKLEESKPHCEDAALLPTCQPPAKPMELLHGSRFVVAEAAIPNLAVGRVQPTDAQSHLPDWMKRLPLEMLQSYVGYVNDAMAAAGGLTDDVAYLIMNEYGMDMLMVTQLIAYALGRPVGTCNVSDVQTTSQAMAQRSDLSPVTAMPHTTGKGPCGRMPKAVVEAEAAPAPAKQLGLVPDIRGSAAGQHPRAGPPVRGLPHKQIAGPPAGQPAGTAVHHHGKDPNREIYKLACMPDGSKPDPEVIKAWARENPPYDPMVIDDDVQVEDVASGIRFWPRCGKKKGAGNATIYFKSSEVHIVGKSEVRAWFRACMSSWTYKP